MAASTINTGFGTRTRVPGVYARLNGDALAQVPAGVRRLVLIGEAVGGKPVTELTEGEPTFLSATSAGQVRELFASGMLRDAGLAAFDASRDERVGGPGQVLFAKVNPATQASAILPNAINDSVALTSVDYGATQNQIKVSVNPGTTQGYALQVELGDLVESADNIGGDSALDLLYASGGDFDGVTAQVDGSGLTVGFDAKLSAETPVGVFTPGDAPAIASSDAYDTVQRVTVYGLDAGGGAISATGTLNGATPVLLGTVFQQVTGVRVWGATRGTVAVSDTSGPTLIFTVASTITANHTPGTVEVLSSVAGDAGVQVVVSGVNALGAPISEVITVTGTVAAVGSVAFEKVISAEIIGENAGNVTVQASGGGAVAFVITAGAGGAGLRNAKGLYLPRFAAFEGQIDLRHDSAPGVGTWVAVVRGIDTDGAEVAEVVPLTGAFVSTAASFRSVSQIDIGGGEAANDVMIQGTAISFGADAVLSEVATLVDALPGFTASADADAADYTVSQLDYANTSILGAAAFEFFADLDAIVAWFNTTTLVTAERIAGAALPPSYTVVKVGLSGAVEGTTTQADWQAALDALRNVPDVVVAVLTTNTAVHAAWTAHARYMEGAGGNERNGYVPLAMTLGKSGIRSAIVNLNDRNTAAVAQNVVRFNEAGVQATYGPEVLAAMAAAMQCGAAVGEPLTRKGINAIAFTSNSGWTPGADKEEMLGYSLLFAEVDRNAGPRWVRGLTTRRTNPNPIFTEISANDSANESVRRVRANLQPLIGRPAVQGFADIVKSLVIAELDRQVADGVIRDYQSVAVFDQGDTFVVEYQLAALEPLNFIRVEANLTRILASAA